MKIQIEVPEVTSCAATSCTYNTDAQCHARAITIGNGASPAQCDTFVSSNGHVSDTGVHAGVGACHATRCQHNQDYECNAPAIDVTVHGDRADCATFTS